MSDSYSPALLVPHFNHMPLFTSFLPELVETGLPVIVVDDGSDAHEQDQLKALCEKHASVTLLHHKNNRGKGAAFCTGLYHAAQQKITHVVQVDADAQHELADLPKLLRVSKGYPQAIISGRPCFGDDAPKARVYGRKVTDFWVALETLSLKLKDSLCGYRVYPLQQTFEIYDQYYVSPRMSFDTEILVKACWSNIDVHYIDTQVKYHEQSISHFHYLNDNLALIGLHTRLMIGMVLNAPRMLYHRIKRQ